MNWLEAAAHTHGETDPTRLAALALLDELEFQCESLLTKRREFPWPALTALRGALSGRIVEPQIDAEVFDTFADKAAWAEAVLVTPRAAPPWKPGRPLIQPIEAHPYLIRCGFPEQAGHVHDKQLLIPMYHCRRYGKAFLGLQRFADDGPVISSVPKGAVFCIGSGQEREQWLVESYPSGLSVRAALASIYRTVDVFCCFTPSNLAAVAKMGIGTKVFADNDPDDSGERAARATGLPYAISLLPGDANDLHRARSLSAVLSTIEVFTDG